MSKVAVLCFVERDKESGGYVAWTPDLRGVVSQGDSIDEALSNFREALEGTIESYMKVGKRIPFSKDFAVSVVEVDADVLPSEAKRLDSILEEALNTIENIRIDLLKLERSLPTTETDGTPVEDIRNETNSSF